MNWNCSTLGFKMPNARQRGLALVSVLGVMAMISIIMAGLTYRQQLSINLQGAALQKSRAFLTVLSVEQIATAMLVDQNQERVKRNYDYYDEDWAEPEIGLVLSGVNVTFMIFDAQARFNINNVNAQNGADRAVSRRILRTLLNRYGNTHNDINEWIGSRTLIAKDNFYLASNPQFSSYRIANAEMVNLHEMRLIAGLRKREELEQDIQKFEDYFAFFPSARRLIKVNVNTADDDLLKDILVYFGVRGDRVDNLIRRRPYQNINVFCGGVRNRRNDCRRIFDNKSSYFYVLMRMDIGDTIVHARSLLRRNRLEVATVMRELKIL